MCVYVPRYVIVYVLYCIIVCVLVEAQDGAGFALHPRYDAVRSATIVYPRVAAYIVQRWCICVIWYEYLYIYMYRSSTNIPRLEPTVIYDTTRMSWQAELKSWMSPSHVATNEIPAVGSKAPCTPRFSMPPGDGRPTVVTFLRHCGCPCELLRSPARRLVHLADMAQSQKRPSSSCAMLRHGMAMSASSRFRTATRHQQAAGSSRFQTLRGTALST